MKLICIMMMTAVMATGCNSKPSDNVARTLALSYLMDTEPGIRLDEINVIKSYEKDGNMVVVVQAGKLVCEMPTIKTKDDWMSRGIQCTGQFATEEEWEQRRAKAREAVKLDVEETKKELPIINGKITLVDVNTTPEAVNQALKANYPCPQDTLKVQKTVHENLLRNYCTNRDLITLGMKMNMETTYSDGKTVMVNFQPSDCYGQAR